MLKKRASHKCVNTMTDCGSHIQVCLHSQICLFFKLGNGAMKNWGERCPCLWWPCFGVSCGGSSCVWDCLQDPIQVVLVGSLLCTLSSSVVSNSLRPHELQPSRLLCPWNFPGKNTEMGCHFILQGIFPTQGLNLCLPSLLHCRRILYHWATGEARGSLLTLVLISRASSVVIKMLYNVILEKAMAPHSSTLAWQIPWMEEPGRLQSMGSLRVGHDWVTSPSLFTFMHWRREWQLTPVFLPGESQGRGAW